MRSEIQSLISLGKLPSEAGTSLSQIADAQAAIDSIEPPVTDSEATALTSIFGEDSCFGLARSLVHLIESCPNWPLIEALSLAENPWISLLRERAGIEGNGIHIERTKEADR
jgi:hypothetical protein